MVVEAWVAGSMPQESGTCEAASDESLRIKGLEVFVSRSAAYLVVLRLLGHEPGHEPDQMYLADLRDFDWGGWAVRDMGAAAGHLLFDRQDNLRCCF
jgi:hypothetical protein